MKTGGQFLIDTVGASEIFTRERFSPEHLEFEKAVGDFAVSRILPVKKQIESLDGELMLGILKECGELGFLCVDIPEEYGGLALDKITSTLVVEKITYGQSGSLSATFSTHVGIGTLPIVFFGTPEQKRKYLPKLATGEFIGAYALTEPGAGSDALAVRTRADLSGDGKYYTLNGTKQFITNGGWADIFVLFGKVNGEQFTAFIVEKETEGLSIGPEESKMGLKGSSTTAIILDNVRVPAENVLGKIGRGHEIAFNILNIGRFKLGAADLGGCKICINESVKYALERRQFGQPIAKFDVIKGKFADMLIRTYALDSIIYRTVGMMDEAISALDESSPDYYRQVVDSIEKYAIESSIAKVYGTESLWLTSDTGLQIFGGYGFSEEYPMAAVVRDTRVDRIFEGTNEINRQIIVGYMMRKGFMDELPIRDRVKQAEDFLKGAVPAISSPILAEEKKALEISKLMAVYLFNETLCRYGQGLRTRQQLGEILSNMFIDVYVIDSVLSRVTQEIRDKGSNPTLEAISRVLVSERMLQMAADGRKAICSIFEKEELDSASNIMDKFSRGMRLNTDILKLKARIAEDLYGKSKYPF
ncbi:MAG: acyl-CoA dehydrogenase family protein [Fidelibacterota bacterium]